MLSVLPLPEESVELLFGSCLNSRDFCLSKMVCGDSVWLVDISMFIGIEMLVSVKLTVR